MGLFAWFRHRRSHDILEGEIKELTNQFHITLRANYARMQMAGGKPSAETVGRLKELLDPKRTQPLRWSEAYEMEQLLVEVYDEEALKTEWQVRRIEALKALHPQLAAFYQTAVKDTDSLERRRGLLARLINDLQWRYTVNEVKRGYSTDITKRTGALFTSSLVTFAAGIVTLVLLRRGGYNQSTPELELIFIAALAGTWGAAFSMLTSLKARLQASELDEMKLIQPWVMLLARVLIGTGAGCVLYFLVSSGLLGGEAFPKPEGLAQGEFKSFALLIMWCFIAGFSEKLVPGILEKNIARITGKDSGDPGRYRPEAPDGGTPTPPPKRPGTRPARAGGEGPTKSD